MAILAISGSGSGASNGNSVAAGSAGEAYVGGSFKGTVDFDDGTAVVQGTTPNGGYQAGFVARYGDDGGLEWLRTAEHPQFRAAALTTTRLDEWAAEGEALLQWMVANEAAWRI